MRALYFIISLFVLRCGWAAEQKISADALLDKVFRQPGEFDQMCLLPPPIDARVPMPLFGPLYRREINISTANIALLKARRAEVVEAIDERLAEMDLSKQPPAVPARRFNERPGEDGWIAESGISSHQLSGLLFEIVVALDAVETLPNLLAIESKMQDLLASAEANPQAEPPLMTADGSPMFTIKKLSKREKQMEYGRVLQRELLSVILQLLRRRNFQPLLASSLEKTYETALQVKAAETGFKPGETPEKDLDPITHVPVPFFRETPSVPYSPQVRDEVRGLAQKFLDGKQ